MNQTPWGTKEIESIQKFVDGNAYRFAFLVHEVPVKPTTLQKIIGGYHEPKGPLKFRLLDLVNRYPKKTKLPHNDFLIMA